MCSHFARLAGSLLLLLAGLTSGSDLAHAGGGTANGATAASSPVQAVRALLHGYVYTASGHPGMQVAPAFRTCFPSGGHVRACPLTTRFLNRLRHPDPRPKGCLGGCTLDPVSRAENTTYWIALTVVGNNGTTAVVNTRWSFDQGKHRLTYTVLRTEFGWQVDDSYCTGHPETTMYRVPVRSCPGA